MGGPYELGVQGWAATPGLPSQDAGFILGHRSWWCSRWLSCLSLWLLQHGQPKEQGGRGAISQLPPLEYWGPLGPILPQGQVGLPVECPHASYSPIAVQLGGHLALSMEEKIWRGKFMDLFSLFHTEPEPPP